MSATRMVRHKMKQEDIVRFIKSQRLRWAGHVMRMEKTRTTRKITELTPSKEDEDYWLESESGG
jgi:hypothetical protein